MTMKKSDMEFDEHLDQVRVIGEDNVQVIGKNKKPFLRKIWILILLILCVIIGIVIFFISDREDVTDEMEQALFEPVRVHESVSYQKLGKEVDSSTVGFTEIRDTLINDIPIIIYIPHNALMSLHIGKVNKADTSIIYTAQAADVRADNGEIVGAFVLKGEPIAWGLSKMGFCASIDGKVTIGVADRSSLFEEATEKGGYFFRQYPLVKDRQVIENEPKGKSIRRGICDHQGEIFMVETVTKESFHDFAQALVDLGVDQAVYLVGSSAYGWAVDEDGRMHEFGDEFGGQYYKKYNKIPKNTSYIVWRKK